MPTTRRRAHTVLGVMLVGAALLIVAAGIVWAFVLWSASKVPVHEDVASVPSRADAPPAGRYRDAAEGGRRLARALLVEGNVPGLSVAVAADGEIVWAEGFGWTRVDKDAPVTPRTRF